jgi:hypothetical protein
MVRHAHRGTQSRHAAFATWFVSVYLVVYVILLSWGDGLFRQIAVGMFLASPVFVVWMAYAVIRHGHPPGRELGPDEEFGYGDRRV